MGCQGSSAVDCCADTTPQNSVVPAPLARTGAAHSLTTAAPITVQDGDSRIDHRPKHFRSLSLTTAEEFGTFVDSGSTIEMGSQSHSPTAAETNSELLFVSPPSESVIHDDSAAVTIPSRRPQLPDGEGSGSATIPMAMQRVQHGWPTVPPPAAATAAVEGTPLWDPAYTVRSPSPFSLTGNRLEDQIRENQLHRALQSYCFNLAGKASETGTSPSPEGAHVPHVPTCSSSAPPPPRPVLHHTRSNSKVRIMLPPVEVTAPSPSISSESLSGGSSGVIVSRDDVHCSVELGPDYTHQGGTGHPPCQAAAVVDAQTGNDDDRLVYSDAQVFDSESSPDTKQAPQSTSHDTEHIFNREGFLALG